MLFLLLWNLVAVAAVMAVTFGVALAKGKHSVVDIAWGLGCAVIAIVTFALSDGDPARRWLVTALTVIWGVRLAVHIGWRSRGAGEDPRYEKLLSRAKGNRHLYALRSVYLVQGVAMWFVSLPVQVTQFSAGPLGIVAWLGVVVWLVGMFFETVGDLQLVRFKAANKGAIMDRGLWRYTRHPNYFGDACVWWGLFLIAADAWPGVLTVLSPLAMTYFLVRGTGAKVLERHMRDRPGFADYVRRTSGFFPLPPKKAA